jgi:uncharacterized membrane protein YesL
MFGFWIKKTFFDLWDNLLTVILVNLGFYFIIAALLGSMYGIAFLAGALLPAGTALHAFIVNLLVLLICGALIAVYSGAVAWIMHKIVEYEKPSFGDFIAGLKATWRPSLLFGLIQGALLALVLNAAQIYLTKGDNMLNWVLFFILFWVYLTWMMASQYFFPLQSRYDRKPFKNIKKMFILFFDNLTFTILCLTLVSLVELGLSFALFFLLPGFAGLMLLQAVALKLRAMKYDYLDEHPQANRRKIPWSVLLVEDRERVGKRSLKSMFMPWKE